MAEERWAAVVGYEGRYEVSDEGHVRAIFSTPRRPPPPRPVVGSPGGSSRAGRPYWRVKLSDASGAEREWAVHVLVLRSFVGPCPPGMECRHLNGQPRDNRLSNLAWGTRRENHADRDRHGRTARGERNGNARLTDEQAEEIRRLIGTCSQRELGRRFGVSHTTIGHIASGITRRR